MGILMVTPAEQAQLADAVGAFLAFGVALVIASPFLWVAWRVFAPRLVAAVIVAGLAVLGWVAYLHPWWFAGGVVLAVAGMVAVARRARRSA
jgi:hypothetical protein